MVTTYLVANAVILTASPFLARRFGRKTFFLVCLGLFTLSSLLCGMAWNLDVAALVPHPAGSRRAAAWCRCRSRSWRTPSRPRNAARLSRCSASRWSSAPVVGPTLGGWLADNISWRWCFLINVPVGLATMAADRRRPAGGQGEYGASRGRFDVVGFLLVADLPRRARGRARSRPRGRLVRLGFIVMIDGDLLRSRLCS